MYIYIYIIFGEIWEDECGICFQVRMRMITDVVNVLPLFIKSHL